MPNRVWMAPLTRRRADDQGVPSAVMAEYYAQRATAGLIVSEATQVSAAGRGYPNTPGLYTEAHEQGWRRVTDSVHAAGGRIVAQLWHVGRLSHSSYQPDGGPPWAPSAIRPSSGEALDAQGNRVPYETPSAIELEYIPRLIGEYRLAALRARAAGFDGVEVHAANGYLLDQFLRSGSNHRTDRYGGSAGNRARLLLEVVQAIAHAWPEGLLGVRISPHGTFNGMHDAAPQATFLEVTRRLVDTPADYLHVVRPLEGDIRHGAEPLSLAPYRHAWPRTLLACGDYDGASAQETLDAGLADAVAFGRDFIANPDLPERLRVGAECNACDESTYHTGGARGYTDYPKLDTSPCGAAS